MCSAVKVNWYKTKAVIHTPRLSKLRERGSSGSRGREDRLIQAVLGSKTQCH